ncbi:PREDICTED: baculoviral IAP repeat-containing protein 5 [Crocodylus porosus]|uniref:Baculoviral IAP repeat containing 5 n=2 Tax=Crocodylia TaxID=1294634 RepID=A0A7M4EVJ8_CROPO|nr:baculoviral IAP repeat-containing protein 5 [Alligator mississippiensis]XP_019399604.1 PREDICTED: baculoviral IAP repeat-containing protein 5 [Crocodylus porosus]KYO34776.1 baculoviral IAP repeat-containing protein 5 [Alligator mississippiensis]
MAEAALPPEWRLYLPAERAATFRAWPFTEGCACTPGRMAAAGFVHRPSDNSPDVAQCFFCLKELEGWEPDDDPADEHRKHSPACAFLSLQKDVADLTLQEFLKLDKERMRNMIKKQISQKVTEVEEAAKDMRRYIAKLTS